MSDLAWEFEEPEPVEASHLLRVNCCACGEVRAALAAPGHERKARCTKCMGSSPVFPALAGQYAPVHAGFARVAKVERDPDACPVCIATQRKATCNWMVPGSHPAPAVSSRGVVTGVYPSAVLKLAERAREAGWEVRQQYAKGCGTHGSTGRPLVEAESFALVFHSHSMTDAGAYAVYSGGSWKSINIGGRALGGATDLDHWLRVGGQPGPLWVEHVQAAAEDAVWRKEQAKKRNALIKKLYDDARNKPGGKENIAMLRALAWLAQRFGLTQDEVRKIVAPPKGKREGLS